MQDAPAEPPVDVANGVQTGGDGADARSRVESSVERDVLAALGDPRCRAILRHAGDQPVTAAELREATGMSTSTLYRKLDHLTGTPLLSERQRITGDGNHPRTYRCAVGRIHVELTDAVGRRQRVDLRSPRADH